MWVFAGGMFRSGSTLQFQLVSEMIERAGLGRRMDWSMPDEFGTLADDVGETDELLVYKTHVCKHPMRERLRDGRARAVGAHRDLRDVLVSGAQKAGVEPTVAYCEEMTRGCLACAEGWPEVASYREWSYERITRDTASVCGEMAEHLGVPCSRSLAEELAASYSPDEQGKRIARAATSGGMVRAVEGYDTVHMERELLHPNHLQDGRTGKWRDILSDEAVRVVEAIAGEWLLARGYGLTTNSEAA